MNTLKTKRAALILVLCAAIALTTGDYRSESHSIPFVAVASAAAPQDTVNLDRRISLLEQRFYSIESSINRLERQSTLSQRTSAQQSGGGEMEVNLLRAEIETLRRRIGEIECGLIKLDERTATPAAREARRKANAAATDPCRYNAEFPIQLSTRP
jgi:chromosome segregation ATPase